MKLSRHLAGDRNGGPTRRAKSSKRSSMCFRSGTGQWPGAYLEGEKMGSSSGWDGISWDQLALKNHSYIVSVGSSAFLLALMRSKNPIYNISQYDMSISFAHPSLYKWHCWCRTCWIDFLADFLLSIIHTHILDYAITHVHTNRYTLYSSVYIYIYIHTYVYIYIHIHIRSHFGSRKASFGSIHNLLSHRPQRIAAVSRVGKTYAHTDIQYTFYIYIMYR